MTGMANDCALRVGMIGCGAMAHTTVMALLDAGITLPGLTFLVPSGSIEATRARVAGTIACPARVVSTVEALLEGEPDVVVECANQAAVAQSGPAVLRAGRELIIASAGALADPAVEQALGQAAGQGGSRFVIAAGAVGGIDILAAVRLSGLEQVTYISRKPPQAWRGSPAETKVDLAGLKMAQVFFEGPARLAAREYPKNANVAATVALAGLGMDATKVQLIADPAVTHNVHEIAFVGAAARGTIRLEGLPSPANPRTSLTAGYSLARLLFNRVSHEVI